MQARTTIGYRVYYDIVDPSRTTYNEDGSLKSYHVIAAGSLTTWRGSKEGDVAKRNLEEMLLQKDKYMNVIRTSILGPTAIIVE